MVFEGGILQSVALLAVKYWMSGRDLIGRDLYTKDSLLGLISPHIYGNNLYSKSENSISSDYCVYIKKF